MPKETDTEKRQRTAQTAMVKIAESDDPVDVKKAELWRVMTWAKRLRDGLQEGA